MKNKLTIILIIAFSFICLNAQSLELNKSPILVEIQNLTMEDGLPSTTVERGLQDSRGFMWFPTKYGLVYYDGKEFATLTKVKGNLRSNHPFYIAEDSEGRIWVRHSLGTDELDLVDIKTHKVTPAEDSFPSIKNIEGIPAHVFADSKKAIYLTTDKGYLYKLDNSGEFLLLFKSEYVNTILMNRFFRVGEKGIWFNYDELAIRFMDNDGNVKEIFKGNGFDQPVLIGLDNDENLLFTVSREIDYGDGANFRNFAHNKEIRDQNIFRATSDGKIEKVNQKILNPVSALNKPRTFFSQDELTKQIIVINKKIGVVLITPDYKWKVLIPPDKLAEYPNIERSRAIFDNLGNIWLTPRKNGIYKLSIRENKFTNYLKHGDLPNNSQLNFIARGIFEDENRNIYVNGSTSLYKISANNKLPIKVINDWSGLSLSKIDDKLFVGSQGLRVFSEDDKLLYTMNYKHQNESTEFYNVHYHQGFAPNQNYWSVYKSTSGKLWVGLNRGLFYYDESKESFVHFDLNVDDEKMTVYQIFNSRDGKLWAVSNLGLFQFDEESGESERYWAGGEGKFYLSYDELCYIHEDSDGIFWIASYGDGLIKWDRQNKPQVFSVEDGLSSNILFAVLEDDFNRLWISSYYGLNSFNKSTGRINTYFKKDGLTNDEFTPIAYHKASSGKMYFGTVDGLNSFNPADLTEETDEYNVPLQIIAFNQFENEKEKLVDKTLELVNTNKIKLQPGDKFFTLQFSLLNYEKGKNRYAYKFEGIDDDWNYISENSIRISNLDYGNYVLKIKGQNQKGRWSKAELNIDVEVLSPFYNKAWFIISSILGLGLIIISYLRYRVRLHEKERERLEFEVQKRTEEIESDKKIIEKQAEELKELDAVKTRLFANISHELRTPLTLILGPLDAILKERYGSVEQKVKNIIARAAKNGNQLLRLIEQILDLSSLEAGKLIINTKLISLSNLIKRIENSFEPLAESKEIIWFVNKEFEDDINFMLDDDKFGKIIYNLLSNAFKFTPAGGEVSLSVRKIEEEKLRFKVKDTGKGIPEEDMPKIFDRFFQSSKMQESNIGGSGIGLAFAKELSVALGGDLNVESKLGEGTTFTLELPYKKSDVKLEKEMSEQVERLEKNNENEEANEAISLDKEHTILVVEDNTDLQDFIKEVLSVDYSIFTAGDGVEAMEFLTDKSNKIDFIISDIMMPRMDGFTLLEKIKADDRLKKLPVIMLTAKATTESKIKALRVGVDDYMYKPFVPEELVARVKNLLFHYEQREEEISQIDSTEESQEKILPEHEQIWLEKAEKLCSENIGDSRFNVSEFAYQMALSERQLHRTLKNLTGMTPNKYIREIKLQKARELIDVGKYKTLSEVIAEIGFERTDYFVKLFTQRFGVAPQTN